MPNQISISRQRAFTLIELLVVILIIGILIAIAAPSFLNQQNKAHDSAVKQTLTVVRKAAKAAYTNNGQEAYPGTTAQDVLDKFADDEPQYNFVLSSASMTDISISRPSDTQLIACQQSRSTVVFCLITDEEVGLEQIASTNSSMFDIDSAYAAGLTDTVYATGTGSSIAAAQAAATCVLIAATNGTAPSCTNGQAGWGNPEYDDSEVVPFPVNTVSPSITGAAVVGHSLTANDGTWTNASEFTYQWQRSDGASFVNIEGANAQSYTLTTDDLTRTVRVNTTAAGYAPAVTATSTPTAVVTGIPTNTALPVISGSPEVTLVLTATPGTWENASSTFSYQWYRGATAITGATASAYTLVTADLGALMRVRVTNTNNGDTVFATSNNTSAVEAAPTYASKVIKTMAPTAFWKLDEGGHGPWSNSVSGGQTLTRIGNGNGMSFNGRTEGGHPGMETGSLAVKGGSGGGNWLQTASPMPYTAANGGEFTASIWVLQGSNSGYFRSALSVNGRQASAFLCDLNNKAGVWSGGGANCNNTAFAAGTPAGWSSLVMRRKDGITRVYANGVLRASLTTSADLNGILRVGGVGPESLLDGFDNMMDNVAYFDRAISDAELAKLSSPAVS